MNWKATACACTCVFVAGASHQAESGTTLLWASQPTFANETVLVWGSGLSSTKGVLVDGKTKLVPVDVSATSFKVTLPPGLSDGIHQLCTADATSRTAQSNDGANCLTLNSPDVWWWRGDTNLTHATTAVTGGWVRVFGRLMDEGGRLAAPTLALTPRTTTTAAADATIELTRVNGTANDALYMLPASVGPGTYGLAFAGIGGSNTTVELPGVLSVAPAEAWPYSDTVWSVNTTKGLWEALNQTKVQGGGTIELARGTYVFEHGESIDLPPFTTLRGKGGAASVHLVWDTDGLELAQVPKYFVGGNSTFAVEGLTISSTRFFNNIITDGWDPVKRQASRGVRILGVRIRADCFFRLTERDAPPRRGLVANFTYEQTGSAIALSGQQYVVADCDIYTSDHGIYLGHGSESLDRAASIGLVQRNRINFGGDCYQIDSSSHVVFEGNDCVGINLFSRGSAAGATYGGPAASFNFFAANSVQFVFGGDQEILTLDGGYSPASGTGMVFSSDGLNVTFPNDPTYPQWCPSPGHCVTVDTNWTGAAMYVLQGQGQGQLRVFRKGGKAFNRTWTLESPFGPTEQGAGVPLDASSFVSVFERRERMIIRDNQFVDGGPVQLYGGMWHAVVANNSFARTNGALVLGLNHKGSTFMPCYFTELTHNVIVDRDYCGSNSAFTLNGYYNASAPFSGAMVTATVLRNNTVDDGEWSISGAVADVLVEGNTVTNGEQCTTSGNPGRCGDVCCSALWMRNGTQPDGSTNVTTVFRVRFRNNVGLE